jgi:hypothetical protein
MRVPRVAEAGGLRHAERWPADNHARRRAAVMRRRTRRLGLC